MALTPALVSDVIGIIDIIALKTFRQGQSSAISVLWFVISVIILVAHGIVFTRRALIWIVENTPEEKPVNQSCSFHSVRVSLGLMMNLRVTYELMVFLEWLNKRNNAKSNFTR